jgi:hypothetical protein
LCLGHGLVFLQQRTITTYVPGTYDSSEGNFEAGAWTEILSSEEGLEGKAGNEIQAGAEGYYKFEGALLSDVILLGTPYG